MEAPAPDIDRSDETLKRNSVRGVVVSFASQGLRFVLQFGSQIVLARMLDPAAFGLVAMALPVLTLMQLLGELGLTQATIQRADISQQELSSLFWVSLAVNVVLAAITALAAPAVALLYNEPQLTAIVLALAGLLVLNGLASQQMAMMNRQMRFVTMAVIDLACLLVAVVAGVAAAWEGLGYWSLVIMQAANLATIAGLAWALSGWRPSRPSALPGIRGLLEFGAHLTGYNLVLYAGSNLDSVLIGAVTGSTGLGLYDRANKLVVTPLWQFGLPLARVATNLLSRLQDAGPAYRRSFERMLQGLMLVTAPGFVWAALVSDRLVPALFGPQWADAAPVVAWLAVATLFAPFGISSYWLFVSQARVQEQLRWACVRSVMSLAALVAGLPWGVTGVAVAYAASAPLVQGALIWGAARRGPVRPIDVWRAAYPVMVGIVASAAALLAAQSWAAVPDRMAVPQLTADLLLSYAACGASLLCFPAGLRLLRDLWDGRHAFRHAPH